MFHPYKGPILCQDGQKKHILNREILSLRAKQYFDIFKNENDWEKRVGLIEILTRNFARMALPEIEAITSAFQILELNGGVKDRKSPLDFLTHEKLPHAKRQESIDAYEAYLKEALSDESTPERFKKAIKRTMELEKAQSTRDLWLDMLTTDGSVEDINSRQNGNPALGHFPYPGMLVEESGSIGVIQACSQQLGNYPVGTLKWDVEWLPGNGLPRDFGSYNHATIMRILMARDGEMDDNEDNDSEDNDSEDKDNDNNDTRNENDANMRNADESKRTEPTKPKIKKTKQHHEYDSDSKEDYNIEENMKRWKKKKGIYANEHILSLLRVDGHEDDITDQLTNVIPVQNRLKDTMEHSIYAFSSFVDLIDTHRSKQAKRIPDMLDLAEQKEKVRLKGFFKDVTGERNFKKLWEKIREKAQNTPDEPNELEDMYLASESEGFDDNYDDISDLFNFSTNDNDISNNKKNNNKKKKKKKKRATKTKASKKKYPNSNNNETVRRSARNHNTPIDLSNENENNDGYENADDKPIELVEPLEHGIPKRYLTAAYSFCKYRKMEDVGLGDMNSTIAQYLVDNGFVPPDFSIMFSGRSNKFVMIIPDGSVQEVSKEFIQMVFGRGLDWALRYHSPTDYENQSKDIMSSTIAIRCHHIDMSYKDIYEMSVSDGDELGNIRYPYLRQGVDLYRVVTVLMKLLLTRSNFGGREEELCKNDKWKRITKGEYQACSLEQEIIDTITSQTENANDYWENEMGYYIELIDKIKDCREYKGRPYYWVYWANYTHHFATWEPIENVEGQPALKEYKERIALRNRAMPIDTADIDHAREFSRFINDSPFNQLIPDPKRKPAHVMKLNWHQVNDVSVSEMYEFSLPFDMKHFFNPILYNVPYEPRNPVLYRFSRDLLDLKRFKLPRHFLPISLLNSNVTGDLCESLFQLQLQIDRRNTTKRCLRNRCIEIFPQKSLVLIWPESWSHNPDAQPLETIPDMPDGYIGQKAMKMIENQHIRVESLNKSNNKKERRRRITSYVEDVLSIDDNNNSNNEATINSIDSKIKDKVDEIDMEVDEIEKNVSCPSLNGTTFSTNGNNNSNNNNNNNVNNATNAINCSNNNNNNIFTSSHTSMNTHGEMNSSENDEPEFKRARIESSTTFPTSPVQRRNRRLTLSLKSASFPGRKVSASNKTPATTAAATEPTPHGIAPTQPNNPSIADEKNISSTHKSSNNNNSELLPSSVSVSNSLNDDDVIVEGCVYDDDTDNESVLTVSPLEEENRIEFDEKEFENNEKDIEITKSSIYRCSKHWTESNHRRKKKKRS
eukprot:TRINITY_DN840_c0_g5_i1.p1 TRINITY_DN840_c0_g5~~TRINITY_DN840_c0_g5_i1.p1  ORF type:complete len:1301 (-),score=393.01 TRINITY_DN840_c0_g5_i1:102-4004(-)